MSPTLWIEATEMDARFCMMEWLWNTEGVRSLSPNLRCAHRQRFQVCAHAHSLTLADSPCLGVAHSPQLVWTAPRPGVASTPEKLSPGIEASSLIEPASSHASSLHRACIELSVKTCIESGIEACLVSRKQHRDRCRVRGSY